MDIGKRKIFSLIILLTINFTAFAQNVGTDSPYGRYGYGSLSNPSLGAAESMGGIGYGLRRSQQVNPSNPASYSSLDTLTFIFDIGFSAHYSKLNDGIDSHTFKNGNLDYIAMQFPIIRNVGASVGLLPYSKVGYNYGRFHSLSDVQYMETFRGTGGLNRVYGGLAYAPIKQVSVGVNASYLFGSISHSRVVTPNSSTSVSIGEKKMKYTIGTLMTEIGAQYTLPITKEEQVTLGVVYTPKVSTKSVVYPSEMMYSADPYTYPSQSPTEIIPTDTLGAQTFRLPESLGAGLTYSNRKFLAGIDGTYQRWQNLDYPNQLDDLSVSDRFNDVFRVNAGVEYAIEPLSRNYLHRIRFRGGVSYSNSYINTSVFDRTSGSFIGNDGFKEYGVNLGLGLPFRDNVSGTGYVSFMNIGFSYSLRQPNRSQMIKEETFKVFVNMNINEFWFFKRKFD